MLELQYKVFSLLSLRATPTKRYPTPRLNTEAPPNFHMPTSLLTSITKSLKWAWTVLVHISPLTTKRLKGITNRPSDSDSSKMDDSHRQQWSLNSHIYFTLRKFPTVSQTKLKSIPTQHSFIHCGKKLIPGNYRDKDALSLNLGME